MTIHATIRIPGSEFEFGQVIETIDGVDVELESIVPLGEQAMPLIEVHNREHAHESFAQRLQDHPAVATITPIESSEECGTYAVE